MPTYISLRVCQIWTGFNKNWFRNKHLTKLCIKCPLHLKYVLALPWEIRSWNYVVCRILLYSIHRVAHVSANHYQTTEAVKLCYLFNIIWKSLTYLILIISYQDLGCRRTETTHQERVGRSESRCWTCCWWEAPASARLRSRWRRTFRAYYDVKMVWLTVNTFDDFWGNRPNCRSCLSLFNDWINMYM